MSKARNPFKCKNRVRCPKCKSKKVHRLYPFRGKSKSGPGVPEPWDWDYWFIKCLKCGFEDSVLPTKKRSI